MGYDHSMNAEISFKPAVSIEDVLLCLHPLLDYFGWTKTALLENCLDSDNAVEITEDGNAVQHLSLYTCGEVGYSFSDTVQAFAKNLAPLTEPGFIELRDHDTGDLENAIQKIWYGDPQEVLQAQRIMPGMKRVELCVQLALKKRCLR